MLLLLFRTRMWANAQRDGHLAEYRWRRVQRRKVWLTSTTRVPAVTLPRRETRSNLQGYPKLPNRSQPLVGRKFIILRRHVEEVLLFNKFFPIVDTCLSCEDTARQSCAIVLRWRFFGDVLHSVFFSNPRAAHFRPAF